MTIGIAVKLDNFIGLFADSREVSANNKCKTIDDKNKIDIIEDSVGLIRGGIS